MEDDFPTDESVGTQASLCVLCVWGGEDMGVWGGAQALIQCSTPAVDDGWGWDRRVSSCGLGSDHSLKARNHTSPWPGIGDPSSIISMIIGISFLLQALKTLFIRKEILTKTYNKHEVKTQYAWLKIHHTVKIPLFKLFLWSFRGNLFWQNQVISPCLWKCHGLNFNFFLGF